MIYRYTHLFALLLLFALPAAAKTDTTIGLTAPGNVCHHYQDLAHYLCDGLSDDEQKANAIYNWITHNIRYNVKGVRDLNREYDKIVESALKKKKAICEGYSMLFVEMCREVGIKAAAIDGYGKDFIVDNGDKLYIPRHMWAAVYIKGKWQFVEPTWGAGGLVMSPSFPRKVINFVTRKNLNYARRLKFRYAYKPDYFLQDPNDFRLKHLPADPLWQLSDTVMPREVFEAGDSAVKAFNSISRLKQDDPELLRIAQLADRQRMFEAADRQYAYNDRYPVVLATKHTLRAIAEVNKAFTDTTVTEGKLIMRDAENAIKQSQGYIADQKKVFPKQYSELTKKNRTKSQEAKQYVRLVKADSKRNMAQFKKYSKSAGKNYSKLKTRFADVRKRSSGLSPSKLSGIESATIQKKKDAPELRAIEDSVAARELRVAAEQQLMVAGYEKIRQFEAANSARLDSLARAWQTADSYLVIETRARLSMHDSYDDEVIASSKMFKEYKFNRADTLSKYYLASYDSVVRSFNDRHKARRAQLDIYKQNVRSLEQYYKWNSSDPAISARYAALVNEYRERLTDYNNDLKAHASYLKAHRSLFAKLAKQNQRELKLADYMVKADDVRKQLEGRAIAQRKWLDNRENEKHKVALEKARRQLEKFNDSLN